MLEKRWNIIRIREFHSVWQWRKKIIFPSISSRMRVLQYYSRVFRFIKRWERPLLKEIQTGYSPVIWDLAQFKLIEMTPLTWAGCHRALCRQSPPCRAPGRIPACLTGSPLPETAQWLLFSCSYLFWAKIKCSYRKPEQPNSSNQSLQSAGAPCCQQLTDIIKEDIFFYLPLDN